MGRDGARNDPSGLSVPRRLRFLARDSAIYGGASALNAGFSLITFPLLSRHFSIAEYGLVDFFTVACTFLTITFVFGQDSAVARFFYEYKDADRRRQIVSQSLLLQLTVMLAVLPLLWLAAGKVQSTLSGSAESELLVKLVLLQVPFMVLINFSQNLLKWTFSRSRFLVISVGSVVLRAVLLVVAVVWFDVGVAEVFLIMCVVQAVFATVGIVFIRQWLDRPAGVGFLRDLLPFAIPYGVICSIGAFAPTLERSIVSGLLGAEDLGYYAAGAKVAMLIGLPIRAFQTAWGPFSLAIHKEADAGATYNWILKGFAVGVCSLVLLLSVVADPVIRLLASDRYAGAVPVVFPLAMALAIQATSWITEIGIGLSKKSYLSLYVYGMFLVASGLAVYVLTQVMGLVGAALGVTIGHMARAMCATYLAQRAYRLPWSLSGAVLVIVFTLVVGLLGQAVATTVSASAGSLVCTLGLLLLLPLSWLSLFSRDERLHIALFLSARPRRVP